MRNLTGFLTVFILCFIFSFGKIQAQNATFTSTQNISQAPGAPLRNIPGGAEWLVTGNSGTSPATNFLGTADTATLIFKVNSEQSGWIDDGLGTRKYQNTFFGYKGGIRITTGHNNTGIGFNTLEFNTTGVDNTAIGVDALSYSSTGSSNSVLGVGAGIIQNGSQNVFVGDSAGWDNPGNGNTYIGYEASRSSSFLDPSNATAIGYRAHATASNQVVLGNTSVTSFVFNGDLEAGTGNYGTSGQVLISQGARVAPQWATITQANYLDDTIGGSGASPELATLTNSWSFTGNAGTSPAANFIGTRDSATLVFKVNGVQSGWIDDKKYQNTFLGYQNGTSITTGSNNTGIGFNALHYTSTGANNTAIGDRALLDNHSGSSNTVIGANAGIVQNGSQNVFIGDSTGFDNTGNGNTFIGYEANRNSFFVVPSNATAIGYQAAVSASNQVVLGNTNVTSFVFNGDLEAGNGNYGNPGQVLISQGAGAPPQWGSIGTSPSALSPITAQTLQAKNDSLHSKLDSLYATVDSLRNAFKSIQSCLTQLCANAQAQQNAGSGNSGDNNITNTQDITLSSTNSPVLYQNSPNPIKTGSKINYYIPEGTAGATIVFYDSYGNQIKQAQLNQTGSGSLNITADNLSNGVYSYSLIVNGNVIDTKRMVLQK